MPEKW